MGLRSSRTGSRWGRSCRGRSWSGYAIAGRADEWINEGRHDQAAELYREAGELAPDSHELRFWAGLGAIQGGEEDAGAALLRSAIEEHPPWRELLERLPVEVAPSAAVALELLAQAPR